MYTADKRRDPRCENRDINYVTAAKQERRDSSTARVRSREKNMPDLCRSGVGLLVGTVLEIQP